MPEISAVPDAPMEFQGYCRSMPEVAWNYEATSEAVTESRLMYRVMRAWSFARRHGFRVRGVLYKGTPLNDLQLERLNLWIQGGGAAEAAKMEHWEAVKLFEKIILG